MVVPINEKKMTKYKFKAKDIKTGEWIEGDLAYVTKKDVLNLF